MKYISTRGKAPELGFEDVLLSGLASDGGLYIPKEWPKVDYKELPTTSYSEQAAYVIYPFVKDFLNYEELNDITSQAYSQFPSKEAIGLKEVEKGNYLLELFHGPTLAFKDFAMLLLAQFFETSLSKKNKSITILGATSGDTGSAAIEAFKNNKHCTVFILFPKGRVSEIQRKQMTTVDSASIYPIEIDGTFDDCQNLVKNLFQNLEFKEEMCLGAINSINWARVAAQIVYYFSTFQQLKSNRVSFSVPTGNFGDVLAGWVAKKMGLPIDKLIVATNDNDILDRAISNGDYFQEEVKATTSPSMDIQISSNFERLLFESLNKDSEKLRNLFIELKENNGFRIDNDTLSYIKNDFKSGKASERKVKDTISRIYKVSNIILDPHTAVGFYASAKKLDADVPMVNLGTAHPAKFSQAVIDAIGLEPEIPDRLKNIINKKEKFTELDNNSEALIGFIRKHSNV
ncbi:MAG: threonine synthase [Rhodobiaceae bacterium]|nr:threonine synthase [Rhodobiaceae bacterium]